MAGDSLELGTKLAQLLLVQHDDTKSLQEIRAQRKFPRRRSTARPKQIEAIEDDLIG